MTWNFTGGTSGSFQTEESGQKRAFPSFNGRFKGSIRLNPSTRGSLYKLKEY